MTKQRAGLGHRTRLAEAGVGVTRPGSALRGALPGDALRSTRPGHALRSTRPGHALRSTQGGLTLIEVLVSILIFSFGLLGFVGLQARAIQYSVSAEDSNRAALLANELATQMVMAQSASPSASVVAAWQARASDPTGVGLPNGTATVSTTGNVATITMSWTSPSAASGAASSVYVTQVIIP